MRQPIFHESQHAAEPSESFQESHWIEAIDIRNNVGPIKLKGGHQVYRLSMLHSRVKLACVVVACLTVIMVVPQPVHAAPPIGLDGVGSDIGPGQQSLTTTRMNDVVILIIECGFARSCDGSITSIIDNAGLNFLLRVAFSPGDSLWEYYAVTKSPLTSDNVTVIGPCNFTYHLCRMLVFAIMWANTADIFDLSPLLPVTVSCLNPGSPCSAPMKSSTIDLVIASVAENDAPACGTGVGGVPGFTWIGGSVEAYYQIVIPHRNVTFSCVGFSDPDAIVLDAISFPPGFR